MDVTAFTADLLYFMAVVLGDVIRLLLAGMVASGVAAGLIYVTAFAVRNE